MQDKAYRLSHKKEIAVWRKKYRTLDYVKAAAREYNQTEKYKQIRSRCRASYNATLHGRFMLSRNAAFHNAKTWTLTEVQYGLLITKPCYYCGGKLNRTGGGLDRIDNALGYELENVLSACGGCNILRNNRYTVDETKAMIEALIKYRAEVIIKQTIAKRGTIYAD